MCNIMKNTLSVNSACDKYFVIVLKILSGKYGDVIIQYL